MVRENLIARLPHREPFLFVTSIESMRAGEEGVGTWSITGDEWFFAGHFPDEPIVPGVLLTEALAQLAGLVVADEGATGGRLAQMNVRLRASVQPPAEVRLEASVQRTIGRLWLFSVRATCEGVEAASGTLSVAIGVPADARRG